MTLTPDELTRLAEEALAQNAATKAVKGARKWRAVPNHRPYFIVEFDGPSDKGGMESTADIEEVYARYIAAAHEREPELARAVLSLLETEAHWKQTVKELIARATTTNLNCWCPRHGLVEGSHRCPVFDDMPNDTVAWHMEHEATLERERAALRARAQALGRER